MSQPRPHASLPGLAVLMFSAVFVLFFYTLAHEAGHALLGILYGGKIHSFSANFFNGAHVGFSGSFTSAQKISINLAGMSLPILLWTAYLLTVQTEPDAVSRLVKSLTSIGLLGSLLPWVVIPVLYMIGLAPKNDDATHFIENSGLPPFLVSILFAVLLLVLTWFFFTKLGGTLRALTVLRVDRSELLSGRSRRTMITMGWLLFAGIFGTLMTGVFTGMNTRPADPFQPPEGYILRAEVDLSEKTYNRHVIDAFTIKTTSEVGLFILFEEIKSPYFDLVLVGPTGTVYPVYHARDITASASRAHRRLELQPGSYHIVLTSRQSPGNAAVFLSLPAR